MWNHKQIINKCPEILKTYYILHFPPDSGRVEESRLQDYSLRFKEVYKNAFDRQDYQSD